MQKFPMYKILLSVAVFIGIATCTFAQQTLVFENIADSRRVEIFPSNLVKLEYNGYLKQEESSYGVVVAIKDSILTLHSLDKKNNPGFRDIHVKDITAFRKFKKGRLVLEPLVTLGFTVSSIVLFYWLGEQHPNLSFGTRLGISFGVSAVSAGVSKLIFHKRVHIQLAHGWKYSLKLNGKKNDN